jgi:hypothetical protein
MVESYTGQVRNGVVVIEEGVRLAERTHVRVEPIGETSAVTSEGDAVDGAHRLLLAWGRRAEADAPQFPSDLAAEHDYYAHGKPRP